MITIKEKLQSILNVLNAEMTRNEPSQLVIRLMATKLQELADEINN